MLSELRFLLVNLVEGGATAKLNGVFDVSSGTAWIKLFAACDYFQSKGGQYHFALITDKILEKNIQGELFRIPWSLIMDFDPASGEPGGLMNEYINESGQCNPPCGSIANS